MLQDIDVRAGMVRPTVLVSGYDERVTSSALILTTAFMAQRVNNEAQLITDTFPAVLRFPYDLIRWHRKIDK